MVTNTLQRIEVDCLKSQSNRPFTGRTDPTDAYSFTVRTPKFFHFDEDNTNQFKEYMPNGIDLKNYILQHYPAPTPESLRAQCQQLGKAIGRWLKSFTEWNSQQPDLRRIATENKDVQQIKHMLNYLWLYDRIKEYPAILEDVKDVLEQVEKAVDAERQNDSKLHFIHGDFWTGK
jgi:hypothetical protein